MVGSNSTQTERVSARLEYRAEVLAQVTPGPDGLRSRAGDRPLRIGWEQVQYALAADVGEPEGVMSVVFDLLVRVEESRLVVYRFDADPGDEARDLASALASRVGRERSSGALRAVASNGISSRWYPDLDSLDEANLEAVRRCKRGLP